MKTYSYKKIQSFCIKIEELILSTLNTAYIKLERKFYWNILCYIFPIYLFILMVIWFYEMSSLNALSNFITENIKYIRYIYFIISAIKNSMILKIWWIKQLVRTPILFAWISPKTPKSDKLEESSNKQSQHKFLWKPLLLGNVAIKTTKTKLSLL